VLAEVPDVPDVVLGEEGELRLLEDRFIVTAG
jgi:hypothetical protein